MPGGRLAPLISIVLLLALALPALAASPKEVFAAIHDRVAVSLGADWANDSFARILADAAAMDEKSKAVAALVGKMLKDGGVTDSLDLSFSRAALPLDNVHIRVLRFADVEKATTFFKQKFQEHADFNTVGTGAEVIGKKLGKRARLVGTACVSVFKLTRDDDATLRFLDLAAAEVGKLDD